MHTQRLFYFYIRLHSNERYYFGKADKLKSRKLIELLFNKGKQFSHFPFKVVWLPQNDHYHLQAGIGVSSRYFKKAVDRNRIKRLMREAYRLQKSSLHNHLVAEQKQLSVFILYTGKELPDYETVFVKFGTMLKRLQKMTDEIAKTNT